ncbi:MAG: outer membrane beta-barrel protein, partial [Saprospiraceae bacterium]
PLHPSPFTLHPPHSTLHTPHSTLHPSITLESGPFATAGLRSAGFSGALVLGHTFGKSAWGIQGGLGYSYFNNPFPVAALTQNNRAEDFQELEIGNGTTPVNFDTAGSVEAFASSADSTVSRLHYLDIPVLATRKLGQRWQLQAGASLGLLLASRTETGFDAGYGLVSGKVQRLYDDQVTGEFSGAEAAAALSRLRIANPSIQAGIAYFPHPRWSIGLQINAALLDAMPDWPGRQSLNKAQLKLGYRF